MFRKKEGDIENVDSLIGENIKVIGKIEGKGNLRIDGTVDGDIDYDGNIVIGETGKVNGNIKSDDISLAGNVNGNISSKTKLIILSTGTLMGDIEVSNFIVHENGRFEGNSKMGNNKVTELHSKEKKDLKVESK